MEIAVPVQFNQPDLEPHIDALNNAKPDRPQFGMISSDMKNVMHIYNTVDADYTGLSKQQVIGLSLFTDVVPCINNILIAQHIEDAIGDGAALDVTLNYVLTQ